MSKVDVQVACLENCDNDLVLCVRTEQGHGATYLMSPETAVEATLADPVLVH